MAFVQFFGRFLKLGISIGAVLPLVASVTPAFAQSSEPAVVRFVRAPFKELVGKTKLVQLTPSGLVNRIVVSVSEEDLGSHSRVNVEVLKAAKLHWTMNANGDWYARFVVAAEDLAIYAKTECDSEQRLCRGSAVLDLKATAGADMDPATWGSNGTSITRVMHVYLDPQRETQVIQIADGSLREPAKLLKIQCSELEKRACNIVPR